MGGAPFRTLRRIVIPLLIPGMVSGWILMATMFVRELTLSVVLSRPGSAQHLPAWWRCTETAKLLVDENN